MQPKDTEERRRAIDRVNRAYADEDVADLPTIETAIPRLREIFAGADEVIGYNVGFDLGFLSAVGVHPREDARITDTMNLFTRFMGRRYKLVDAADHIGYEWTGRAHGSLADALATLAVQRWLEQAAIMSLASPEREIPPPPFPPMLAPFVTTA